MNEDESIRVLLPGRSHGGLFRRKLVAAATFALLAMVSDPAAVRGSGPISSTLPRLLAHRAVYKADVIQTNGTNEFLQFEAELHLSVVGPEAGPPRRLHLPLFGGPGIIVTSFSADAEGVYLAHPDGLDPPLPERFRPRSTGVALVVNRPAGKFRVHLGFQVPLTISSSRQVARVDIPRMPLARLELAFPTPPGDLIVQPAVRQPTRLERELGPFRYQVNLGASPSLDISWSLYPETEATDGKDTATPPIRVLGHHTMASIVGNRIMGVTRMELDDPVNDQGLQSVILNAPDWTTIRLGGDSASNASLASRGENKRVIRFDDSDDDRRQVVLEWETPLPKSSLTTYKVPIMFPVGARIQGWADGVVICQAPEGVVPDPPYCRGLKIVHGGSLPAEEYGDIQDPIALAYRITSPDARLGIRLAPSQAVMTNEATIEHLEIESRFPERHDTERLITGSMILRRSENTPYLVMSPPPNQDTWSLESVRVMGRMARISPVLKEPGAYQIPLSVSGTGAFDSPDVRVEFEASTQAEPMALMGSLRFALPRFSVPVRRLTWSIDCPITYHVEFGLAGSHSLAIDNVPSEDVEGTDGVVVFLRGFRNLKAQSGALIQSFDFSTVLLIVLTLLCALYVTRGLLTQTLPPASFAATAGASILILVVAFWAGSRLTPSFWSYLMPRDEASSTRPLNRQESASAAGDTMPWSRAVAGGDNSVAESPKKYASEGGSGTDEDLFVTSAPWAASVDSREASTLALGSGVPSSKPIQEDPDEPVHRRMTLARNLVMSSTTPGHSIGLDLRYCHRTIVTMTSVFGGLIGFGFFIFLFLSFRDLFDPRTKNFTAAAFILGMTFCDYMFPFACDAMARAFGIPILFLAGVRLISHAFEVSEQWREDGERALLDTRSADSATGDSSIRTGSGKAHSSPLSRVPHARSVNRISIPSILKEEPEEEITFIVEEAASTQQEPKRRSRNQKARKPPEGS